jgi:hypothetical protein
MLRVGFLTLLGVVACTAASSGSGGTDLIGGHQPGAGEYGPTLLLRYSCTAAKVGPRHILTAAHCVTGATLVSPGQALQITTARATGTFAAPDAATPWRNVTVDHVEVQPAWVAHCAMASCYSVTDTARADMGDAAVIITREDLTDIAEAAVDLAPVANGDRVVMAGYGCEQEVGQYGGYDDRRLKVVETDALPFDAAIHPGSFIYPEDRASGLVASLTADYVITPGPASAPDAGDAVGGLCPGDSGGPLYRLGTSSPAIVGVNANYTFSSGQAYPLGDDTDRTFFYGGKPTTNWHTRLDGAQGQKVGAWLQGLGVNVISSR